MQAGGGVHVHLGGRVPSNIVELVEQGPMFVQCFECVTRADVDAASVQEAVLQSVRLLKRRMSALQLIARLFEEDLSGDDMSMLHHTMHLVMTLLRSPQLQEGAHFASGLWLHSAATEQLRSAFHGVLATVVGTVDRLSSASSSSTSPGSEGGGAGGGGAARRRAPALREVIVRCGLKAFGECRFQTEDQHWCVKRLFCDAISIPKTRSCYQDRLGTNIGKASSTQVRGRPRFPLQAAGDLFPLRPRAVAARQPRIAAASGRR